MMVKSRPSMTLQMRSKAVSGKPNGMSQESYDRYKSQGFSDAEIAGIWEQTIATRARMAAGTVKKAEPEPEASAHKLAQLEIVNRTNPAPNDTLTWIRTAADIMTYSETVDDIVRRGYEGDDPTPDYTWQDITKALKTNRVTVYSSYPIKNGTFVTPSRMEAEAYAGNGPVYRKTVTLDKVAWIDELQGQYAHVKGASD